MRAAAVLVLLLGIAAAAGVFYVSLSAPPDAPVKLESGETHDMETEIRDLRTANRALTDELAAERGRNEALAAELDEARRRAATARPTAEAAKLMTGAWHHDVVGGAEGLVTFTDEGVIHTVRGDGTWTLTGTRLELRWRREGAPGGEWIDVCALSADGRSYVGENQNGVVVRGRRRGD